MIRWDLTLTEPNKTKLSDTIFVECDSCHQISNHKYKSIKYRDTNEYFCQSCRNIKKWQCKEYSTKMKKSFEESKSKHKKAVNSAFKSKSYRDKISENQKRLWKNKEYQENQSNKTKKQWESDSYRKHMLSIYDGDGFKSKYRTPSHRSKMSEISKKTWEDPEFRKKMSDLKSDLWRKEEYKSKFTKTIKEDELYDKYVLDKNSIRKISQDSDHSRKIIGSFVDKYGFEKHDFRISKDEFLDRAKEVHGNRYDYSNVNYESYNVKVEIVCQKHGSFWQVPKFHIYNKNGCPLCSGTNLQISVYEFVCGLAGCEVKNDDRKIIGPNELDIVVEDKSLAIEINGLYWHSFGHKENSDERNKHVNKLNQCIDEGIRLIQINENEWIDKREIVESILKSKLGLSNRIYARKCKLEKISSDQHKKFMNQNHIQGGKGCSAAYGLKHDNELVAVMSFNKHPKHEWEITRFANKLNTTVVGGASRLFKRFLNDYNPTQILTYADRRYSDGNLYKKLGFKLDGITKPNYCYVKKQKVYSRQKFMKHKLKDKLDEFDPDLTEAENMFNNGYRRLWDAGNYRFIWPNKDESLQPRNT